LASTADGNAPLPTIDQGDFNGVFMSAEIFFGFHSDFEAAHVRFLVII
jgi:hypothetical protein